MKHSIKFSKKTVTVKATISQTRHKNDVTTRVKTPNIRSLVEEKCPPNVRIGKALKESSLISNDPDNLSGRWVFELIEIVKPVVKPAVKTEPVKVASEDTSKKPKASKKAVQTKTTKKVPQVKTNLKKENK